MNYVVDGATLICGSGSEESKLSVVKEKKVYLTGKPVADVLDYKPENTHTFGICTSALSPVIPHDCSPICVLPWLNGKCDHDLGGGVLLTMNSILICMQGGIIRIIEDGQGQADVEQQENKEDEEKDLRDFGEIWRRIKREMLKNAAKNAHSNSERHGGGGGGAAPDEPVEWESTGTLEWPVPLHGRISSGFGMRPNPTSVYHELKFHYGIDIVAPEGAKVVAADAGKVTTLIHSNVGYGNYIIIDHGNRMATLYAHLSKTNVLIGAVVSAGQDIGLIGKTGNTTGAHLHFEVRIDGTKVNPSDYVEYKAVK